MRDSMMVDTCSCITRTSNMSDIKYSVESYEMQETKGGDPYKQVTLDNGETVNVFNRSEHYPKIEPGYQIDKDLLYKKKGYVNLADSVDDIPDSAGEYEGKEDTMSKAMSRKERGIKISSTARMATDVVAAEIESESLTSLSKDSIQQRWKMWRAFFSDQWDHPDDYTDPEDVIES